ncbi:ADOP family duplicated permease [Silvibacterium sp.]|uniref:ABC transporter permease n=1 Tax=Silvibacterium sp. TaxID=1964179 RepID=UPI0039E688DC
MSQVRALFRRVTGIWRRDDGEFAAELEGHLAMEIEDGMRRGLTEQEARRQALVRNGGLAQAQQAYRERGGLPWLEQLMQDVAYGARTLAAKPGFAVVAILTLALGIGANTAMFSVVDGVLLHPLPFPHPEELVTVNASKPNFSEGSVSYPNFRDWHRDNRTLAGFAISRGTGYNMTGLGDAEEVRAELVSSDFFSLLGVKPLIGRLFAPGEDEIGRAPLAMVSESFWKRKLGGDPKALGHVLTLDGRDYTLVGVIPESFRLAVGTFRAAEIYVPIGQFGNPALKDRGAGLGLHGIARLKPGVTFAQAQEDLLHVSERLEQQYPREDVGIRAKLTNFQDSMVREVRPLLLVLLGAVGCVLLIACVNVANLMLARAHARSQEFAVRAALGAGRGRLIRQLLTESAMLSLAGGALGLLVAALGTKAAIAALPATLPRAAEIHMNGTVLLFTLGVSLLSGMLFGLAPARKVSRQSLVGTLKEGGRGSHGGQSRAQSTLAVLQIGFALVLLAGAGLAIRSLVALSHVQMGFQPHGVLTFGLQAAPSVAREDENGVRSYLREAEARIAATPGIEAVSFSWGAIPLDSEDDQYFWLDREAKPQNQNQMHMALRYNVGPGYLKTMGMTLLRGRFLQAGDDEHAPPVVVIDDIFANTYFKGQDPIGREVHFENLEKPSLVVGVVAHVNQWGLDSDASQSLRVETFQPVMQLPPVQIGLVPMGVDVLVRAKGNDTGAALAAVKRAMTEMSREQVVYGPATMDSIVNDSLAGWRFSMILLSVFAGVAVVLASLGIYGVIAYAVSERRQEIGVRMALGADRSRVMRWVLAQGGRLALIGVALGLGCAALVTPMMASSALLFGVRSFDPLTMGAVTGVLLLVALAACAVPAWRATRVDPMAALRTE